MNNRITAEYTLCRKPSTLNIAMIIIHYINMHPLLYKKIKTNLIYKNCKPYSTN